MSNPPLITDAKQWHLQPVSALDSRCFNPMWSYPKLARDMRDHSHSFLVAEIGGEVVGYAIARHAGYQVHIERLAVAPDHRREGIGHALLWPLVYDPCLDVSRATIDAPVGVPGLWDFLASNGWQSLIYPLMPERWAYFPQPRVEVSPAVRNQIAEYFA